MRFSQKLLLTFLVISIIPVLISGSVYNREVDKSINDKVHVFFRHIVEQNASFIEYEIKDIETIINSVIGNEMVQDTLLDFNTKSSIEKVDAWLDILPVSEGALMQNSNIQSIAFILFNDEEFIIFGDSTSDESRDYYRFFRHESYKLDYLENNQNDISWHYRFIENRNKLLISRNLIYINSGEPIGIVAFIVDIESITNIINNADTGNGEIIYMLDDQGNEIGINNVSSTDSKNRIREMYHELIEQEKVFERPIVERSGIEYISKDEAIIYALLKNGFVLISEVDINLLTRDIEMGRRTIYSLILLGIIVVLVISFIFSRYVSNKFTQLSKNMILVQNGEFDIEKPIKSHGDEFTDINMFFYNMARRLKVLINKTYIQEIEKKEANLQALQNQINPHFLYNTLEVIRSMSISGKSEEIGEVALRLGNLFRYNLSGSNIEFVSVEQELEHIKKNYVYLMNIHYNNRIILFIECEERLLNAKMPRFILQPIIENSIIHGFKGRNGEGVIEIEVKKDGSMIQFMVTDDGIGMDPKDINEFNQRISRESNNIGSIGLQNVNQRIQLAYGKEFGVHVEGELGYLIVHVTIPYKEIIEDDQNLS